MTSRRSRKTKKRPGSPADQIAPVPPTALQAPIASASWFPEPDLIFASGERSYDPKVGCHCMAHAL